MKKIKRGFCLFMFLVSAISCKEELTTSNADLTLTMQAFVLQAGSNVYLYWLKTCSRN